MGNCLKSPTSDDISLLHESQSDRASYGDGAEPDQEPPPPYQVGEGAGSAAAESGGGSGTGRGRRRALGEGVRRGQRRGAGARPLALRAGPGTTDSLPPSPPPPLLRWAPGPNLSLSAHAYRGGSRFVSSSLTAAASRQTGGSGCRGTSGGPGPARVGVSAPLPAGFGRGVPEEEGRLRPCSRVLCWCPR